MISLTGPASARRPTAARTRSSASQPGDGALVDELAVQPAQLGVARVGVEGRGERAVGGEDVLGAALQGAGHALAQLVERAASVTRGGAHRACLTSSR